VKAKRLHDYALAKPGAWADQPWEGDHVAKVGGKIFAFLGQDGIGVKCAATREEADEWLARYPEEASVMAYLGRSGWNSLSLPGSIPDDELLSAVDDSYRLVVSRLPKKHRPEGWDS
jgi:predicted DNA-binding protein (MmcQ/YjbR family)